MLTLLLLLTVSDEPAWDVTQARGRAREVGFDLLVLGSSPLEEVENTLDLVYVMKGGILYQADSLDEIWPENRE